MLITGIFNLNSKHVKMLKTKQNKKQTEYLLRDVDMFVSQMAL